MGTVSVWRSHREDIVGGCLALTAAAGTYYWLTKGQTTENKHLLVDPSQHYEVMLVSRENLSHNVIRLRFDIPNQELCLGLETGQHVQIHAEIDGHPVNRNYTPTTLRHEKGFFELIIKVYGPTTEHPTAGQMTRYLNTLPIGEMVKVRGPIGQTEYLGGQKWTIRQRSEKHTRTVKKLGMVAGGSGITPMLQIIHRILSHPSDSTEVNLVFANSTSDDVFLKDYLDNLEQKSNGRLHIWYTVSRDPAPEWQYSVGRVDFPMLKRHLSSPSNDHLVFLCGPKGFISNASAVLGRIGHNSDNIIHL